MVAGGSGPAREKREEVLAHLLVPEIGVEGGRSRRCHGKGRRHPGEVQGRRRCGLASGGYGAGRGVPIWSNVGRRRLVCGELELAMAGRAGMLARAGVLPLL